jgi:hypothetical protein
MVEGSEEVATDFGIPSCLVYDSGILSLRSFARTWFREHPELDVIGVPWEDFEKALHLKYDDEHPDSSRGNTSSKGLYRE